MRYGYCRVSTEGQDVELQMKELKQHRIDHFYCDSFTGKTMDRPKYKLMCNKLRPGDVVLVTKLDRFTRSVSEGAAEIERLVSMGVRVHILNMGIVGDAPGERLLLNIMMAFSEFERSMIVERTQAGKALAKQKDPNWREGRLKTYNDDQIKLAFRLYQEGNTMKEITRQTGISKATFYRRRDELKAKGELKE